MTIAEVRIQKFRGIESLDLELGLVTVIIGENNSGKTSVLDALKLCLRDSGSRRRVVFEALDFHLRDSSAEPTSSDAFQIAVTFSKRRDGKWDDHLVGRLNRAGILQVDDDARNHVRLLITCEYDQTTKRFRAGLGLIWISRDKS